MSKEFSKIFITIIGSSTSAFTVDWTLKLFKGHDNRWGYASVAAFTFPIVLPLLAFHSLQTRSSCPVYSKKIKD
jgi:hypothetical protein